MLRRHFCMVVIWVSSWPDLYLSYCSITVHFIIVVVPLSFRGWGMHVTYLYTVFVWFWWNYHQVSFIQILLDAEPKPIFFLNVHLETGSCCCYHCQRQVYLRAIVHYFPLVGVFDAHAPGTPDHDCWPCHPPGQRGSLRWPLFRVVFGHHGGSTDLAFLYLHHVTACHGLFTFKVLLQCCNVIFLLRVVLVGYKVWSVNFHQKKWRTLRPRVQRGACLI